QWNPDEHVQNPEDWTLGQNVVIHDTLPSQLDWNTSAEDFIDAGDFELTEAIDFEGSAADFAADSYVGQYAVIGQDLYINVGQDTQTNVSIDVRAIITTLDGLNSWVDDQGWVHYTAKNDASFTYRDGDSYDASAETELIDRGDTSGGINDPSKF